MMIFTMFSPGQGGLVRVWDRSWSSRGWTTRIGEAPKNSWKVFVNVINFSLAPGKDRPRVTRYGRPGWEKAALVWFESEDDALNCGRKI